MSRVGKMPIAIPSDVTVSLSGTHMKVTGPKGELERTLNDQVDVTVNENEILVAARSEQQDHRALHGLTRTLISNMVTGVTTGFEKTLEIVGVGYRASKQGEDLEVLVGYSHPISVTPAASSAKNIHKIKGIEFEVPQPTRIIVKGCNKEDVGEMAAQIRKVRPPEPYKGKGIMYSTERVRRKVGKAGK